MEKVRPCPFCGVCLNGLDIREGPSGDDWFAVHCYSCLMVGPERKNKTDATRAWNAIRVVKKGKKK